MRIALLITLTLLGTTAPRADTAPPGTRGGGQACLSGGECASGECEGKGCDDRTPGRCAATGRGCLRNHVPFCSCDGQTFYQSSSCPGRRYRHQGACEAACEAVSAAVRRELERLLKSAAEHATYSNVCADGNGEKTTLSLTRACVQHPVGRPNADVIGLSVELHYRVTIVEERSGECSPYPECARASPPRESDRSFGVELAGGPDGFTLIVPKELPGVPLKSPLAKAHSMGCHGEAPAFVPRNVKD